MVDPTLIIDKIREMVERAALVMLAKLTSEGFRDPFQVLVATVLSHRTKDEISIEAARRLLAEYPTPQDLARASLGDVERLIKPVGFYRVKARRLVELSRVILSRYGGAIPSDLDELLALPSVGRKTANAVLAYGFGIPALVIDTHAHRIMNRIGLVSTKTPEETEMELRRKVDSRLWLELNNLLVPFGRHICKPADPRCGECLLISICAHAKPRSS